MRFISYDETSSTLSVDLSDGTHYEVFDVPPETVKDMQSSPSLQDFFNNHIWGSKFEHRLHWPNLNALLQYMGDHMSFEPPVTVHSRLGDNDTPLHTVCVWGDIEAVNLLLNAGADPNARGDLNCTPLYNAVSFGHVRCVERLLEAGANPDDSNELHTTARKRALESKNPKLVVLFSDRA